MSLAIVDLLEDIKKSKAYANRGRELEKKIERAFRAYSHFPNFFFVRLEIKQSQGKFLKKQPCDFLVINGQNVVAFDCKETKDCVFYMSKVPTHQLEALAKLQKMGHNAGLVIWFKGQDETGINLRFISDFGKSATVMDGKDFLREIITLK